MKKPTRKRVQRGSIQAVTLCEVNCIAKYTCSSCQNLVIFLEDKYMDVLYLLSDF